MSFNRCYIKSQWNLWYRTLLIVEEILQKCTNPSQPSAGQKISTVFLTISGLSTTIKGCQSIKALIRLMLQSSPISAGLVVAANGSWRCVIRKWFCPFFPQRLKEKQVRVSVSVIEKILHLISLPLVIDVKSYLKLSYTSLNLFCHSFSQLMILLSKLKSLQVFNTVSLCIYCIFGILLPANLDPCFNRLPPLWANVSKWAFVNLQQWNKKEKCILYHATAEC